MQVYLDAAATTRRKPECVYRAVDLFMREVGASPGRSAHGPGIEAGRIVASARERMARMIGAADASRVVFTLNCTEALNLAIKGTLRPGCRVVVGPLEHNSVMRPLRAAADAIGVTVSRLGLGEGYMVDPDELAKALDRQASLVVLAHASNVVGAIQPIEQCCRVAHERGVPVLVDGAQACGCLPVDVAQLGADMYAFSGHKALMGPQGVGGLYIRPGLDPAPLKHGGTGSASSEEVQPAFLPDRYESGTPNTPGLAGLAAALEFIGGVGIDAVRAHSVSIGSTLLDGLRESDGVTMYAPENMRDNAGIFSFTLAGIDNAAAAVLLEERHGVLTRIGLHCAPAAHRAIGTWPTGTIRASVGYFTTEEEVRHVIAAVREVARG